MTITQLINHLESIRTKHGNVQVIGYTSTGWYISAMGGGELIKGKQPSEYHKFVVALHTDSTFERD